MPSGGAKDSDSTPGAGGSAFHAARSSRWRLPAHRREAQGHAGQAGTLPVQPCKYPWRRPGHTQGRRPNLSTPQELRHGPPQLSHPSPQKPVTPLRPGRAWRDLSSRPQCSKGWGLGEEGTIPGSMAGQTLVWDISFRVTGAHCR